MKVQNILIILNLIKIQNNLKILSKYNSKRSRTNFKDIDTIKEVIIPTWVNSSVPKTVPNPIITTILNIISKTVHKEIDSIPKKDSTKAPTNVPTTNSPTPTTRTTKVSSTIIPIQMEENQVNTIIKEPTENVKNKPSTVSEKEIISPNTTIIETTIVQKYVIIKLITYDTNMRILKEVEAN